MSETAFESAAATRFAIFWRENAARTERILARAEALARALQARSCEHLLCHADNCAANILMTRR